MRLCMKPRLCIACQSFSDASLACPFDVYLFCHFAAGSVTSPSLPVSTTERAEPPQGSLPLFGFSMTASSRGAASPEGPGLRLHLLHSPCLGIAAALHHPAATAGACVGGAQRVALACSGDDCMGV